MSEPIKWVTKPSVAVLERRLAEAERAWKRRGDRLRRAHRQTLDAKERANAWVGSRDWPLPGIGAGLL